MLLPLPSLPRSVNPPTSHTNATLPFPVRRKSHSRHPRPLQFAPAYLQVGFIANLKNVASHKVVSQALTALGCMEHRGACSADDDSGDGAGVMTQIPWKLLKKEMPAINEHSMGCVTLRIPEPIFDDGRAVSPIPAIFSSRLHLLLGSRR